MCLGAAKRKALLKSFGSGADRLLTSNQTFRKGEGLAIFDFNHNVGQVLVVANSSGAFKLCKNRQTIGDWIQFQTLDTNVTPAVPQASTDPLRWPSRLQPSQRLGLYDPPNRSSMTQPLSETSVSLDRISSVVWLPRAEAGVQPMLSTISGQGRWSPGVTNGYISCVRVFESCISVTYFLTPWESLRSHSATRAGRPQGTVQGDERKLFIHLGCNARYDPRGRPDATGPNRTVRRERPGDTSRGERRVKFGVFLNQYYTDSGAFTAPDLLEQAELMESVGFDSATVGERHVHDEGFVEPITALAAIAARTDSLELGTAALLPALYDPLHLAETIATIDDLSDGRASFGAALGYRERELAAFGVEMDERVGRFLESIELLKRFWAGEAVTHDGDFWDYEDAFVSPAPNDIPVWIGGHADIAIKRAAYRGDAWIASASSTTDDLRNQIGVYEDAIDEFGMDREDNDVILMRDCFVGDSVEDARSTIEPYLLNLYELYARWGQTYMDEHEVEVDYDELAEKFVIGSPANCIDQLQEYEDIGVDHVLIRCQFPGQPQETTLSCLERFGNEVIPVFR